MDLKLKEISYNDNGSDIRYTIGKDGILDIVDDFETIKIIKESGSIELSKPSIGSWTLHMYANVSPDQ